MSAIVPITALGVALDLVVPESLEAQVRDSWHLCVRPSREASPSAQVEFDGSRGEADGLQRLTQAVTRAAVSARAGEALMLHAAGLCNQQTGASVAAVARGGTGKTTLIRTLGPGRGYLTDETVAIESDDSICPYLKPVSVRRKGIHGSPGADPKDEVAPQRVGLAVATVTPWLAGLILLRRDRSPGTGIAVESLGVIEAIEALAPETSALGALPRPLHRLAELIERTGGVRQVHYAEAGDLGPVVEEILGRTR